MFASLKSVQVKDWFVSVSHSAFLRSPLQKGVQSVVLGSSLLLLTIFTLQVLFPALS